MDFVTAENEKWTLIFFATLPHTISTRLWLPNSRRSPLGPTNCHTHLVNISLMIVGTTILKRAFPSGVYTNESRRSSKL